MLSKRPKYGLKAVNFWQTRPKAYSESLRCQCGEIFLRKFLEKLFYCLWQIWVFGSTKGKAVVYLFNQRAQRYSMTSNSAS